MLRKTPPPCFYNDNLKTHKNEVKTGPDLTIFISSLLLLERVQRKMPLSCSVLWASDQCLCQGCARPDSHSFLARKDERVHEHKAGFVRVLPCAFSALGTARPFLQQQPLIQPCHHLCFSAPARAALHSLSETANLK